MGFVSRECIDEIRARCNVVEVVQSYLPQLRRRGATWKCNCPFHEEKTPSFTVNEARQIFHCFGCGAGGDVFRFVMDYEKVDFVTAVELLAERTGVELRYEGGGAPQNRGDKTVLYELHRLAASFFRRVLLESAGAEEARRYLEERALSRAAIDAFGIGYAPNEWDAFMKRALKKGFSSERLEAAGLIVPSEKGGYDRFRNRIVFSICDQMGRVIGFSGRILNAAEKSAKYVNSPETLLFRKSRVLFAFDKARKAMVDTRRAVLVEGQIDAIRCHLAGEENVVASQGTALTEEHARLIKRHADEVVLVLDADAAGIKAALASSEIFLAAELGVRIATLPEGEDPDSLILEQGPDAFRKRVEDALPALEFLIERRSRSEDAGTDAGRMRTIKAALNLISKCPIASMRDSMMRRAAVLLDVSERALREDFRRLQQSPRSVSAPRRVPDDSASVPERPRPPEELAILEMLTHHHEETRALVHDYLPASCFSDPVCRELAERLVLDVPSALLAEFDEYDEATQRLVSRIQVRESRGIDSDQAPEEMAKRYVLQLWRRRIERERKELRQSELSAEEWFEKRTRSRHDLELIAKGWDAAAPMIETRIHEERMAAEKEGEGKHGF